MMGSPPEEVRVREAVIHRREGEELGITLRIHPDGFLVHEVIDCSPAHRAGIAPGDRIRAINGRATLKLTPSKFKKCVEKAGSVVRLRVDRDTLPSTREIILHRHTDWNFKLKFQTGQHGIQIKYNDDVPADQRMVGEDEVVLRINERSVRHCSYREVLNAMVLAGNKIHLLLLRGVPPVTQITVHLTRTHVHEPWGLNMRTVAPAPGIYVQNTEPHSPAAVADLRTDDRLLIIPRLKPRKEYAIEQPATEDIDVTYATHAEVQRALKECPLLSIRIVVARMAIPLPQDSAKANNSTTAATATATVTSMDALHQHAASSPHLSHPQHQLFPVAPMSPPMAVAKEPSHHRPHVRPPQRRTHHRKDSQGYEVMSPPSMMPSITFGFLQTSSPRSPVYQEACDIDGSDSKSNASILNNDVADKHMQQNQQPAKEGGEQEQADKARAQGDEAEVVGGGENGDGGKGSKRENDAPVPGANSSKGAGEEEEKQGHSNGTPKEAAAEAHERMTKTNTRTEAVLKPTGGNGEEEDDTECASLYDRYLELNRHGVSKATKTQLSHSQSQPALPEVTRGDADASKHNDISTAAHQATERRDDGEHARRNRHGQLQEPTYLPPQLQLQQAAGIPTETQYGTSVFAHLSAIDSYPANAKRRHKRKHKKKHKKRHAKDHLHHHFVGYLDDEHQSSRLILDHQHQQHGHVHGHQQAQSQQQEYHRHHHHHHKDAYRKRRAARLTDKPRIESPMHVSLPFRRRIGHNPSLHNNININANNQNTTTTRAVVPDMVEIYCPSRHEIFYRTGRPY
ncbi:hypothetical protein PTSG_04252 [Salpingoeca rosetta]|uniref:PDZ domain-containing protein n=1 Tax=Salpingoeca rosetta (strain ATCC 50818 / BSB-021) TaxID=946362 RepID=F2U713_SALR5|nr:uncharacterized protein PTSG_04252 [Salpingoeca rosetta]EGD83645.1 hypothetical protein PTSG_04252 [Salpingoeca rosetta]|eukprot:XP_004995149.1 hypothetical protein PTSG_04252 [Salpingoeca rosetta]